MANFPTSFLNFLRELPDERLRIVFGDAERLKGLFAEYGIPNDNVRYSIFNKIF